jgi:hypothetical protein
METVRDEALRICKEEFCRDYGCAYEHGDQCGGFPCEDAQEEIDLIEEDLMVEAAISGLGYTEEEQEAGRKNAGC